MDIDPTTIPHRPVQSDDYDPRVGLIGCGSISETHLEAYTAAGYDIVALCDLDRDRAEARRDEYYPDATVYIDYEALLERSDIDVVDIALNAEPRETIVPDALRAGKHVLSQKPFAPDLDVAREQVRVAEEAGVKLAINQNARWALHFSYVREAVDRGLVGVVNGVDLDVYWDKNDLPDRGREYLLLYDYAIHWFDLLACLMDERSPKQVWATTEQSATQAEDADADLLARVTVEYDGAQASLTFGGDTTVGGSSRAKVVGGEGVLTSEGRTIDDQSVELVRATGTYSPMLDGSWFPDGFRGAMTELCSAIAEGHEPPHSGRNNLRTLELTFAAIKSAATGTPQVPGEVHRIDALTG